MPKMDGFEVARQMRSLQLQPAPYLVVVIGAVEALAALRGRLGGARRTRRGCCPESSDRVDCGRSCLSLRPLLRQTWSEPRRYRSITTSTEGREQQINRSPLAGGSRGSGS